MAEKYEVNFTRPAQEYYDKLGDKEKSKVDKKLELAKSNPYRFTRKKGLLKTMWAIKLTNDMRILYSVCKLCHEEELGDKCLCRKYCGRGDDPYNIWVLAIGTHKELRNLKYGGN